MMLSDIRPTGYYNNAKFIEEGYTSDDFMVAILNNDGSDNGMIGWFQYNNNSADSWVEHDADPDSALWSEDVELQPGDALWVCANVFEEGYELSFPGIDDL